MKKSDETKIYIPKIDLEEELDLKEVLQGMGQNALFVAESEPLLR